MEGIGMVRDHIGWRRHARSGQVRDLGRPGAWCTGATAGRSFALLEKPVLIKKPRHKASGIGPRVFPRIVRGHKFVRANAIGAPGPTFLGPRIAGWAPGGPGLRPAAYARILTGCAASNRQPSHQGTNLLTGRHSAPGVKTKSASRPFTSSQRRRPKLSVAHKGGAPLDTRIGRNTRAS